MDLRKGFYNNILISGGTSMIPGFPNRLEKDMVDIISEKVQKGSSISRIKVRVHDPPSRKYSVFVGASLIAKTVEDSPEAWRWRKEYDEKGKHRLASEMGIRL